MYEFNLKYSLVYLSLKEKVLSLKFCKDYKWTRCKGILSALLTYTFITEFITFSFTLFQIIQFTDAGVLKLFGQRLLKWLAGEFEVIVATRLCNICCTVEVMFKIIS